MFPQSTHLYTVKQYQHRDNYRNISKYVPETFTTPTIAHPPLTATAARIFVPFYEDIEGNPWLAILWHE